MNTYLSKEIRWFINAEKAMELEKWFRSMGVSDAFPYDITFSRSDFYLIMPGVLDTGIKVRDLLVDQTGKWTAAFEVKKRVTENQSAGFNENEGMINHWEKFSYPLTDDGESFLSLNPGNIQKDKNWLEIGKERMLVKFDASTGQFVSGASRPEEGCGIELTKLVVNSGLYYSFGLEAFSGSGHGMDRHFQECANRVFDSTFITGLNRTESNSYPEWIHDVLLPA